MRGQGRRALDGKLSDIAARFERALLAGDPGAAEAAAEEAIAAGASVEQIHSQVIAVAMRNVGSRWESNDATVAEEHLATAISETVMARLFPRLMRAEPRSKARVMLAAAEGEHHVIGLRMVADTLEGAGFDVKYLGPDVPTNALLQACRTHRPAALGLTASMWLNAPTLVAEVREVEALEDPPAVFVGGRAVAEAAEHGLDVPVVADCEDAVDVVSSLVDEQVRPGLVSESLAGHVPPLPSAARADDRRSVASAFSATAVLAAEAAREAARHASKVEALAYRDALTGLWNRRAYDDRIIEIAEADETGAILMIDVDRFKLINDSYGHEAGDAALVGVGRCILESIRSADLAFRYGGDEFAVLLPGLDAASAASVAERIRKAVEDALSDPAVTVSIGVAEVSADKRQIVLTADAALYRAKNAGRNRVATADTEG